MNRKELKAAAKSQIKGKIGVLFLIGLVISVISGLASVLLGLIPGGSIVAAVIITPAFALSMTRIYLGVVAGKKPEVKDAFSGFDDFWAAFKVTFLVELKVFLWSLLFVIPGIVKNISYSMALYVLAENKGMSARKCIEESKKMTKGHKMELFVLGLSFIGWGLLVSVTFGIAAIWVGPYIYATFTNAYHSLKPVVEVEAEEVVEETAEAEA